MGKFGLHQPIVDGFQDDGSIEYWKRNCFNGCFIFLTINGYTNNPETLRTSEDACQYIVIILMKMELFSIRYFLEICQVLTNQYTKLPILSPGLHNWCS